MIYHVSIHGNDGASGTAEAPLRTIQRAAALAVAGDTVRVHEGTYREWVQPQNGGTEDARIVYEAAEGEHVVIKGSEIVTDWELVEGTVWKKTLSNTTFGEFNPYAERIDGDWLVMPKEHKHGYCVHTGDVYINGTSMFEASSMEDLYTAAIRYEGWDNPEPIKNPEGTKYRWFAVVDDKNTTIYGNFGEIDPNRVLVEINVRRACFYPLKPALNYITLRGFEIAHAACPFTPPTSDQIGMVGPHWAKGWIIENNHLHDAKCSAISLGKDATTGDNEYLKYNRKHSHYYQTEVVFRALRSGWRRELVGSHIVRNNVIHDCGQNGVVGHLGCVCSRIEKNEIYNIAQKREFFGHEIAGIKLHAAIDVVIENNHIHDCNLGTWLDWQAQGTRLTRNLYHTNTCDLFIEVTHGPCLVDNNLLLSAWSFQDFAQGTALVHNVIAGNVSQAKVLDRQTPYHLPHSTEVMGVAQIFGGDDRILNNLMLGAYRTSNRSHKAMTNAYNEYYEPSRFYARMAMHDFHMNERQTLPVWIDGNAYAGYASPYRVEEHFLLASGMRATLGEEEGEWILTLSVPAELAGADCEPVTTERLGKTVFSEEAYENPDGTPVDFARDFFGNARTGVVLPGPFATLAEGEARFVVWKS